MPPGLPGGSRAQKSVVRHALHPAPTAVMPASAAGIEPQLVGPGDTIFIPRGWSGNWELHETPRKLYVIF